MAGRTHSRSSASALNRLIFLVLLVPLAVIGVAYFLSPNSPFADKTTKPAPILIGQIQKQYKMETAEVTSQTLVEGTTKSVLPFSEEKFIYQVVVTMTAGIDMSTLKDSDISVSGETATVKLPNPQVLRVETSGQVVSHNREVLSGFSENKNLIDRTQDEGRRRVVNTVLEQGKLMQEARINAEDNLRNLILQLGYKNVVFVVDTTTPPATPGVTGPPR